ncbi:MAG: ABC transporter substrate-binding protein [Candidatus Nanopelagicales bacterium]|nr:ABC transporter substrate-binding protein [Candidatus Nanopelagicales bacterium]
MKNKRAAGILAVAASLSLVLAGCASTTDSAEETTAETTAAETATEEAAEEVAEECTEPILIGSAMAQTGFMSPFDVPALDTARIAIDATNAAGGVLGCQLELIEVDGETDPDKGAQIATDLIDQGAQLMLVTCDYDINAKASQVAQDAGVLVIAPCVGDTIMGPDAGLTLGFSLGSAVPGEAAIMAEWAFKEFGPKASLFKDMSIKYTQNQCKVFEERWTQLGGEIVSAPEFSQTPEGSLAAPVTAQVKEIKDSNPDVVALCSYPGGGAEAAAALRAGGVETPVVSGFGMDGAFWLGAVPDLSDFYFVTYASVFGDDPNPKVSELLAAYKGLTGNDAATSGLVTGASSIEAFALAAEQAGSTNGADLAAALEAFDNVDLTAGPTSFSPELHVNVTRPMAVMQVQDGAHSFIEYRAAEQPILN